MIKIEALVSGYGRIGVLDGITFDVAEAECVGILGHNGMGKSTLLKAIIGLLPVWAGSITLAGKSIEHDPPHKRARLGIGYVPQGRQIFPGLSVRENLHFGALAKRLDKAEAEAAMVREFPELTRLLDRSGGTLSGGEQQLLALARALCGKPRILLLDEPTEGIQPSIIKDIGRAISYLRSLKDMAIILVEQCLDFAQELGDHLVVMDRGSIIYSCDRENMDEAALKRALAI